LPVQQPTPAAVEELIATVARLRRQRDKLAKEGAGLSAEVATLRAAAEGSAAEAATACGVLREARGRGAALAWQHAELLRHHIGTAGYAELLEDEVARLRAGAAGTGGAQQQGACASAAAAVQERQQQVGKAGCVHYPGSRGGGPAGGGARACSPTTVAAVASPRVGGASGRLKPAGGGGGHASPALGGAASPRGAARRGSPVPPGGVGGRQSDRSFDQGCGLHFSGQAASRSDEDAAAAAGAGCAQQPQNGGGKRGPGGGDWPWQHTAFDWHRDIEVCKQELEAVTSLFAG
jgi:hypothetical protein